MTPKGISIGGLPISTADDDLGFLLDASKYERDGFRSRQGKPLADSSRVGGDMPAFDFDFTSRVLLKVLLEQFQIVRQDLLDLKTGDERGINLLM